MWSWRFVKFVYYNENMYLNDSAEIFNVHQLKFFIEATYQTILNNRFNAQFSIDEVKNFCRIIQVHVFVVINKFQKSQASHAIISTMITIQNLLQKQKMLHCSWTFRISTYEKVHLGKLLWYYRLLCVELCYFVLAVMYLIPVTLFYLISDAAV